MEKNTRTLGKVWEPISQALSIRWISLHFPMLWEIYGEFYAFPMWWSILQDGNLPGEMHPYYGKSMSTDFPGFPQGFVTFSCAMENWWGNQCISHMLKYTTGWESNGKQHPYYEKSLRANFPGFSHSMVFAEFSPAIGNWLENSCIFHVMKSTIGWESNGKKRLYYGKSMSTNFSGPPHTMGFVAFFHAIGNCW